MGYYCPRDCSDEQAIFTIKQNCEIGCTAEFYLPIRAMAFRID